MLVGPSGRLLEYFSCFLTEVETKKFGAKENQTIIHECKMIAVRISFETWIKTFRNMQAIFCLDNDGARYNLLSGYGNLAYQT